MHVVFTGLHLEFHFSFLQLKKRMRLRNIFLDKYVFWAEERLKSKPEWAKACHLTVLHDTRTKMFIYTDRICINSARFSFQWRTKDLKNMWNICEFCTLDKKKKKMLKLKNASVVVLYSAWSLDVSVCFSIFSFLFVFILLRVFVFWGGTLGVIGNEGSDF